MMRYIIPLYNDAHRQAAHNELQRLGVTVTPVLDADWATCNYVVCHPTGGSICTALLLERKPIILEHDKWIKLRKLRILLDAYHPTPAPLFNPQPNVWVKLFYFTINLWSKYAGRK